MELELQALNLPSDSERPSCVIAGPCSAETEEQVLTTAKQLAAKGCHKRACSQPQKWPRLNM